jgi:hypothetical protein
MEIKLQGMQRDLITDFAKCRQSELCVMTLIEIISDSLIEKKKHKALKIDYIIRSNNPKVLKLTSLRP